ncbi:MAG: sulfatase-like hydrolase/transferase [Verrucomicrobiota bacterium]
MKLLIHFVLLVAWTTFSSAAKPNVLLILADDMGYECLTANGGESYQTPNLDNLAQTGARYTHCYVNPICTPTRVALMTGCYNYRNYIQFGSLKANEHTFGHMMQDAGYQTCIIEKWQLNDKGGTTPDKAGFEEYFIKPGNTYNYADPFIQDNQWKKVKHEGVYGPDLCLEYAMSFVERNKNQPFFLYYPMSLPHFPFNPTPDSTTWENGDRHEDDWEKYMPDMIAYMDKQIGQLVDRLNTLGIRENTLILFVGDNGTDGRVTSEFNGSSFKGGKSWLTDAGTHVPMIVNWKGTVSGGQILDDLIDPTDFMATIAEVTGATPRTPQDGNPIDGISFLPKLIGTVGPEREWVLLELINEFRTRDGGKRHFFAGHEGRCVRNHQWKLYAEGESRRNIAFDKSGQFFDMLNDPLEKEPISLEQAGAEARAAFKKLAKVIEERPWK